MESAGMDHAVIARLARIGLKRMPQNLSGSAEFIPAGTRRTDTCVHTVIQY
jgi:hypothetical protein